MALIKIYRTVGQSDEEGYFMINPSEVASIDYFYEVDRGAHSTVYMKGGQVHHIFGLTGEQVTKKLGYFGKQKDT